MAYQILCLDGGGTFCLVQARALAALFPNQTGHQVLKQFQLVAGTSGGSFVAAALAQGHGPDDLVKLFRERGKRERFFRRLRWFERLRNLHLAQYDRRSKAGLIREITGARGERPLAELWDANEQDMPHLMVIGYDYQYDRAKVFRSHWQSAAANFPRSPQLVRLRDAVNASTHAPVRWFHGVAKPDEGDKFGYWDGAMTGFNNPVMLAVAEAIANGAKREDIRVLSIGTGCTQLLPATARAADCLKVERPRPGLLRDLAKAGKAIIAEPPDVDSYLAHLALSSVVPQADGTRVDSPVFRLNAVIHPVRGKHGWTEPAGFTRDEFGRLVNMDISATADADVALIDRLCDNWIADRSHNQALRRRGPYFGLDDDATWDDSRCCEVGDLHFGAARARWLHADS